MATTQVKGSNFASLRAFAGARGVTERLRAGLEPEVLATLEQSLVIGWYPADHFVTALHALGDAVGDPDATRAYGRFAAEHDLTTLHRVFFRFANPAYVLEKSTQYWSRFHDRGEWRITRETKHGARGELVRSGIVDAVFCDVLLAYITRMFELVGAKQPRWTHPECRVRGAETCVFIGEWR